MHYKDGTPATLGDQVIVEGALTGVIVALIDEGKFASDYPPEQWSYLATGVLIETREVGLIHYPRLDIDLEPVR